MPHKVKIDGVTISEDKQIIKWSVWEMEKQGGQMQEVPRGEGITQADKNDKIEDIKNAIAPDVSKILSLAAEAKARRQELQTSYNNDYDRMMKEEAEEKKK